MAFNKNYFYVAVVLAFLSGILLIYFLSGSESDRNIIYVSVNGSDSNSGEADSPLRSIQKAVNLAFPGDIVYLTRGVYYQSFNSTRNGTMADPIVIEGPSDAVIKGSNESNRVIEIRHDYIHLRGFTVDGLIGDPEKIDSYRDKLVYVQGEGNREGVDGLKVINMTFRNSGGEALRLRYFIEGAEVAYNVFENMGVYDFKFNEGGKNGEAVYIGTSSNQWDDGKNPTSGPDETRDNWIHHNYFNTQGNECVEVKEGSYNNLIEYNICTGQKDTESGGISLRGDKNVVRYNEIFGNLGAGIRVGGHEVNGVEYGRDNEIYENILYNNSMNVRIVDD